MLVTCKICKSKIDKDGAHVVVIKNRNHFYCSEEEYDKWFAQKTLRRSVFKKLEEVIGTEALSTNGSILLQKQIQEYQETVEDLGLFYWTIVACESLIKSLLLEKVIISKDVKTKFALGVIKNNYKLGHTRMLEEKMQDHVARPEEISVKRTAESSKNISHLIGGANG